MARFSHSLSAKTQVTWLLGLCGKSGNAPSQYDDPNVVCTNIVVELKDLGYSQQMNFPPAKLKQGYGDAVCTILRLLVDHALQSTKFSFQKPVYPAEKYAHPAGILLASTPLD